MACPRGNRAMIDLSELMLAASTQPLRNWARFGAGRRFCPFRIGDTYLVIVAYVDGEPVRAVSWRRYDSMTLFSLSGSQNNAYAYVLAEILHHRWERGN